MTEPSVFELLVNVLVISPVPVLPRLAPVIEPETKITSHAKVLEGTLIMMFSFGTVPLQIVSGANAPMAGLSCTRTGCVAGVVLLQPAELTSVTWIWYGVTKVVLASTSGPALMVILSVP